jgi:exosome complex component CSL4
MDTENRRFVIPGERLSVEEELAPSDNTYSEDGIVYAASSGEVKIRENAVSVEPIKHVIKIGRGMMVLGTVSNEMRSVAFVSIDSIRSKNRETLAIKDGKIITKSRGHFDRGGRGRMHDNPRDRGGQVEEKPCKVGDTIIARVVGEDDDIYILSLATPEAGVVYARCSECGNFMEPSGGSMVLRCVGCKRSESRKISSYYGKPEEIKKLFND